MRSGTLAKATGVSPDTIRHYEKLGIVPKASRTNAGYRVYPAATVDRVLVARRALHLGFTLPELADIFQERDAGGAPCQRVYALARQKLAALDADILALQQTASYMRSVLTDWDQRIIQSTPGQRSHLLYSLSLAPARPRKHSFRKRSSR